GTETSSSTRNSAHATTNAFVGARGERRLLDDLSVPLCLCGLLFFRGEYESGRRTEVRAAAFHIDYPRSWPLRPPFFSRAPSRLLRRGRACCEASASIPRPDGRPT